MERGEVALAVEFFAAKRRGAPVLCLAVPPKCGLADADAVVVDGEQLLAMRRDRVLPVDFPPISAAVQEQLQALSSAGRSLPVAEFTALGVSDAYALKVVVVE